MDCVNYELLQVTQDQLSSTQSDWTARLSSRKTIYSLQTWNNHMSTRAMLRVPFAPSGGVSENLFDRTSPGMLHAIRTSKCVWKDLWNLLLIWHNTYLLTRAFILSFQMLLVELSRCRPLNLGNGTSFHWGCLSMRHKFRGVLHLWGKTCEMSHFTVQSQRQLQRQLCLCTGLYSFGLLDQRATYDLSSLMWLSCAATPGIILVLQLRYRKACQRCIFSNSHCRWQVPHQRLRLTSVRQCT